MWKYITRKMLERDELGRSVVDEKAAPYLTFLRLYRTSNKADDWEGPLGAAAEIAQTLGNWALVRLVGYRNERLVQEEELGRELFPEEREELREAFGLT